MAPSRRPFSRRPKRQFAPRKRPDYFVIVVTAMAIGLVGYLGAAAHGANQVEGVIEGIENAALLTVEEAADLDVVVRVTKEERVLRAAELTLNGEQVDPTEVLDHAIRWRPDPDEPLLDGDYVLRLAVPRTLAGTAVLEASFTVDGTAPDLRVGRIDPVPIDQPVTVAGRVEPGATLTLDGRPVDAADDGYFELSFDIPPAGPLRLVATDEVGHRTTHELIVPVAHPGGRGVHVSAAAWNHDELREEILALVDSGRIDTIELSLKDESGVIGHRTEVPIARSIGSSMGLYDLREAVEEIHARGARVIGRLVVFRDPILAQAAWDRGDRDWVVQTSGGQMLPAYGGFTNYAHPEVWQYNIDVAIEAAEAGVDEVLYDYIRRPEGALESMVVPGLEGDPQRAIVRFLAQSYPHLRERGVYQGASVFGIAAARPGPVAQDIPAISRYADVVAPMVYPSLWVSGEYNVDDPTRMPYEIVKKSVADFQEKAEGTGTVIMPWLQHFTLGHPYGPHEVREQIRAVHDLGIDAWLLWSPHVRYDPAGMEPAGG